MSDTATAAAAGKFLYTKNASKMVWERRDPQTRVVIAEIPITEVEGKKKKDKAIPLMIEGKVVNPAETKTEEKVSKFEKPSQFAICHHKGDELIWQYKGRKFFGAGYGGISPLKYDLTIDLAGLATSSRKGRPLVTSPNMPQMAADLNGLVDQPAKILELDWEDQKAIPAGAPFWKKMWELLPKGRILVCCFGSHGRTGTALASLVLTSGAPEITSALDAILLIRAKHCEKAIESNRQLDYLDRLADELGLTSDAYESVTIMDSAKELEQRGKK